MPKIVNPEYRNFLTRGFIQEITPKQFEGFLDNLSRLSHRVKTPELRAFFILLYLTGRRPVELLELKVGDINKKGRYYAVDIPTAKRGLFSLIYLPKTSLTDEVFSLYRNMWREMFLFNSLICRSRNIVRYKDKNGNTTVKTYEHKSARIYSLIKRATGLNPYYFRHHRFSDIARKGASPFEIMHLKGARDLKSVQPYVHMSSKQAKRIAKYLR